MTLSERTGDKQKEKGQVEHDKGTPVLVYKLKPVGWFGAHTVPHKGANVYAVRRLAQDIRWFDYLRVLWKSDQEPALTALRDAAQMQLGASVVLGTTGNGESEVGLTYDESAVGESPSNGVAENALKMYRVTPES